MAPWALGYWKGEGEEVMRKGGGDEERASRVYQIYSFLPPFPRQGPLSLENGIETSQAKLNWYRYKQLVVVSMDK